jgi:hypothetical protein
MKYVYDAGYYVLCLVAGYFFYSLIESWLHVHRWNKWKSYLYKDVTHQYRTCKICNKLEEENVAYGKVEGIEYETIESNNE